MEKKNFEKFLGYGITVFRFSIFDQQESRICNQFNIAHEIRKLANTFLSEKHDSTFSEGKIPFELKLAMMTMIHNPIKIDLSSLHDDIAKTINVSSAISSQLIKTSNVVQLITEKLKIEKNLLLTGCSKIFDCIGIGLTEVVAKINCIQEPILRRFNDMPVDQLLSNLL